ncbi:TPA: thioesterase family protein [Serratia marcescens]|uniref:thioesterase family protein n=1 Tax=Serratia nevei TaxID=2703794 RepID=UPI00313D16F2
MSTTPLTLEAARRKIGEIFVYHMPFNRELGLELRRFDDDYVELSFTNQRKLVGNAAQEILHGGVLTRLEPLIEEEIAAKLSRMGTIDLRVDYLRPGRGEHFVASASVLRSGNKVAVARVELHNHDGLHIATATATYLVG